MAVSRALQEERMRLYIHGRPYPKTPTKTMAADAPRAALARHDGGAAAHDGLTL
jgi:hypothetical protein